MNYYETIWIIMKECVWLWIFMNFKLLRILWRDVNLYGSLRTDMKDYDFLWSNMNYCKSYELVLVIMSDYKWSKIIENCEEILSTNLGKLLC
jgi:hypothetical protein